MAVPSWKIIYGPVHSWRMGMSLGIDPLGTDVKYCNYNCPYCQLGHAVTFGMERRIFISPDALAAEIREVPDDCRIDYLTFSGNGEPTLAANLGALIKAARDARPGSKVAVITNAVLATDPGVRADLGLADLILLKLDAADEETFRRINLPGPGITLKKTLSGLHLFRKEYNKGKLALQIMFTGANRHQSGALARLAADIAPDEVQLNTPLRPSPVKPLSREDMAVISREFAAAGLKVVSVYEEEHRAFTPFDEDATRKRHGRYKG